MTDATFGRPLRAAAAPHAARPGETALRRDETRPAVAPRRRLPPGLAAFLRNPTALAGIALLAVIALGALLASVLFPGDPLDLVARPLLWPGQDAAFPLGTDSMGRDVAAGLAHGARITLMVGFAAAAVSLAIGILTGAVAGYFGGRIDDLLVKLVEIFQTIPGFVLLVVIVAIAQPSVATIIFAIGITSWTGIARIVRAEFRSLRNKDFVMAARGLGYGHARIIFAEILPNALPPIIVTASVTVASAILMESAISFLGLGDANAVSWGSMIGAGRDMLRSAWYLTAIPGLAIVFTVLALNLVGDGLNDALNPRLTRRR